MRRLGVREFRDHATRYLAGDEVLAIERHGRPLGFYIPTGPKPRDNFAQALQRLQQTVEQVLAETGLTEEELSALFDLNKPIPERPHRRRLKPVADERAARR